MYELINGVRIKKKMYKGQPVVTLADIDNAHARPAGTAHRNFKTNRKRFIEGEDYFKVCADEIRLHKIFDISPKTRGDVILLTESGYLMIVKSFTDDLSWSVQRQLVRTYFRVNEITASDNNLSVQVIEKLEFLERKIDMLEKNSENRTRYILKTLFDMSSDVISKGFESLYNKFFE